MTATELLNGIDDILQITVKYYGVLIVLVILQLITNWTIILQLPKITQCNKEILEKLDKIKNSHPKRYKLKTTKKIPKQNPKNERIEVSKTVFNNKENTVENISKEPEHFQKCLESLNKETIELIILGILIAIIILMVFFKFVL